MCESLFTEAPGQKIAPDSAQSWSAPTPTTYIFNIRKGVKFWDGATMTSADVVYSLERNFVAANASIYAYEPAFADIKSVTATGPYTVKVTLKTANVTLVPEMASLGAAVVQKSFAQTAGFQLRHPRRQSDVHGAVQLESWSGSTSLEMVRNDSYWNKALTPKTGQDHLCVGLKTPARSRAPSRRGNSQVDSTSCRATSSRYRRRPTASCTSVHSPKPL